jgi:hypothetical protein
MKKKNLKDEKIVEAGRRSIVSHDLLKVFLKYLNNLRMSEINKNHVSPILISENSD